ncbi:unnamed protein product [Durusdinium trenchii]|uniref:Uncharacterized protein n=1 Tax=Durusdinium trenchii TaxID=1381693 RepID=A0ABP0QGY8_9DINO
MLVPIPKDEDLPVAVPDAPTPAGPTPAAPSGPDAPATTEEEKEKKKGGWSTGAKVAAGTAGVVAVGGLAVAGAVLGEHIAEEGWDATMAELGDVAADAGEAIAGAAEDVGEAVAGAAEDAGEWIAGAAEDALQLLMEALEAAGPKSHPWAAEFVAWQLEGLLQEELGVRTILSSPRQDNPASGTVKVPVEVSRGHRARLRRLLQGVRLKANRAVVESLMEGRLSPRSFLHAEESGDQRERLAQDRAAAAERVEKEVKAAKASSALPFYSEKIHCQGCGTWGARYDRIPHVGGHHQLGKTASLGGTDHARIAAQCASCGLRWRTDEPP